MDPIKFGAFIARRRRERGLTQAQLAERLHVTDKAVSRWERGVGLPDINLLEPLADALDLGIAELMRSEEYPAPAEPERGADLAVAGMLDMVRYQRKRDRREALVVLAVILLSPLSALLFTAPGFSVTSVLFVFVPLFLLLGAAAMLVWSLWRRAHSQPCARTFLAAGSLFFTLLLFCGCLMLSGLLGPGPEPAREAGRLWLFFGAASILFTGIGLYLALRGGRLLHWAVLAALACAALTVFAEYAQVNAWVLQEDQSALMDVVPTMSGVLRAYVIGMVAINGVITAIAVIGKRIK